MAVGSSTNNWTRPCLSICAMSIPCLSICAMSIPPLSWSMQFVKSTILYKFVNVICKKYQILLHFSQLFLRESKGVLMEITGGRYETPPKCTNTHLYLNFDPTEKNDPLTCGGVCSRKNV